MGRRTYNTRLIRRGRSYSVQEIAALFTLHPHTVHEWLKAGLARIDKEKPWRIHGGDLAAFLTQRQGSRKHPCKPNQLYCCKCREAKSVLDNTVDLHIRTTKQLTITGLCATCITRMHKGGSVSKLPEYRQLFNVHTVQGLHLIPRSQHPVNHD